MAEGLQQPVHVSIDGVQNWRCYAYRRFYADCGKGQWGRVGGDGIGSARNLFIDSIGTGGILW